MSISGERGSGLKEEDLPSYTRERTFGHFGRGLGLPAGIDASQVSAAFEDDLLEITIQGGANLPEPQRIDIGD